MKTTKAGRRLRQTQVQALRDLLGVLEDCITRANAVIEWADYLDVEESQMADTVIDPKFYSTKELYEEWVEPRLDGEVKLFASPVLDGVSISLICDGKDVKACIDEFEWKVYEWLAPFNVVGKLTAGSDEDLGFLPEVQDIIEREQAGAGHFWLEDIKSYDGEDVSEQPFEKRLETLRKVNLPSEHFTVLAQRPFQTEEDYAGVMKWAMGRPLSIGVNIKEGEEKAEMQKTFQLKVEVTEVTQVDDLTVYQCSLKDAEIGQIRNKLTSGWVAGDKVIVDIVELILFKDGTITWGKAYMSANIEDVGEVGEIHSVGQAINLARQAGLLKQEVSGDMVEGQRGQEERESQEIKSQEEKEMFTLKGELTDAELISVGRAAKAAYDLREKLMKALDSCDRRGVYTTVGALKDVIVDVQENGAFGIEAGTPNVVQKSVNIVVSNLEHAISVLDNAGPKFDVAAKSIKEVLRELGYTKAVNITEYVRDVRAAFESTYNPEGSYEYWVNDVYDTYVIASHDSEEGTKYYQIAYKMLDGEITFAPEMEWVEGNYEFTPTASDSLGLEKSYGMDEEIPVEARTMEVKVFGETDEHVRVGGYLVKWGSPDETDLQGDYFTPETDMLLTKSVPVMFHHGLDETVGPAILGERVKAIKDEFGAWVEHWLEKSSEYWELIAPLLEAKKLFLSPGSAAHLVEREEDGKLKMWRVVEDSYTPTPCQYRLLPVEQLKGIYEAAGLEFPEEEKEDPAALEMLKSMIEEGLSVVSTS